MTSTAGAVKEITARFGDIRLSTVYRQLSRWAGSGLICKIGPVCSGHQLLCTR
ncbi:hypothetical protein [Streptomyces sp. NPDC005281]|uniref:hypothetical protein n=1 Tax=Streptomyces sp. NPDC005281 TaxID=3155712 RepID=UPI0033AA65FB